MPTGRLLRLLLVATAPSLHPRLPLLHLLQLLHLHPLPLLHPLPRLHLPWPPR